MERRVESEKVFRLRERPLFKRLDLELSILYLILIFGEKFLKNTVYLMISLVIKILNLSKVSNSRRVYERRPDFGSTRQRSDEIGSEAPRHLMVLFNAFNLYNLIFFF